MVIFQVLIKTYLLIFIILIFFFFYDLYSISGSVCGLDRASVEQRLQDLCQAVQYYGGLMIWLAAIFYFNNNCFLLTL